MTTLTACLIAAAPAAAIGAALGYVAAFLLTAF
jgi:hypothetical protein